MLASTRELAPPVDKLNFLKCAFILVQSKLSIPRVAINMSLA